MADSSHSHRAGDQSDGKAGGEHILIQDSADRETGVPVSIGLAPEVAGLGEE